MSGMRMVFVTLVLVFLASPIVGQDAIQPPAYDSIPKIKSYASLSEYDAAVHDGRFRLSRVSYMSDGIKVYAYVYGPVDTRKVKLPVVVFNRGSYVWKEFAGEYLTVFHRLASNGFLVIAPMYRGSGGAEGKDEMGGADVDDLLNTTGVIAQLPGADPGRVFMYGESRGAMMTYESIRDHYPMLAAAVYGGLTDLRSLADPGGKFAAAATMIWPDYAERREAIATRRSAVDWPDRFDTPVLIMHGSEDRDVPAAQALALATRLQQLGKTYQLLIRSGSNHRLSDWQAERDAQAIEWFRRFMK
jgi:dipeptidyl aminopeptidase/acylaminoacyl peptidase